MRRRGRPLVHFVPVRGDRQGKRAWVRQAMTIKHIAKTLAVQNPLRYGSGTFARRSGDDDAKIKRCRYSPLAGITAVCRIERRRAGTIPSHDSFAGPLPGPAFCSAVRGARAEGWPAQSRSEVMAQHGMVVTSQPLAAQAGLQILMRGGNAIDAAVATAGVLSLVEPMMVGVGGDLFAVIYIAKENKIYVLNASGTAPSGATLERFNKLGYHWNPKNWGPTSGMPMHGILPVTVPGAVWGWQAVLKRFGKLTFKEVLEPAAQYAENGFPVSERIASDWHLPNALPLQGCCTEPDPDSIKTWYVNGKPPRAGQIFKNADLARTFRLLQAQGRRRVLQGRDRQGHRRQVERARRHHDSRGSCPVPGRVGRARPHAVSRLSTSSSCRRPRRLGRPTKFSIFFKPACRSGCRARRSPRSDPRIPSTGTCWSKRRSSRMPIFIDTTPIRISLPVPLAKLLSESYAASLCGKVDPHARVHSRARGAISRCRATPSFSRPPTATATWCRG